MPLPWTRTLTASLALTVLGACADRAAQRPESKVAQATGTESSGIRHGEESVRTGPLIVFLGDSLTAGFGVAEEEAFPAIVADLLAERGHPVRIVNAGVSGDTSAGGVSRLDWLLAQRPDIMVIELGANDGLRGLSLEQTAANLEQMVRRSLDSGARVLLVGMKIPPSYGPEYTAAFEGIFVDIARRLEVSLVPFLLEDVAAKPELNLADGIHPNAAGHTVVGRNVVPYLEAMLDE